VREEDEEDEEGDAPPWHSLCSTRGDSVAHGIAQHTPSGLGALLEATVGGDDDGGGGSRVGGTDEDEAGRQWATGDQGE